jgi:5,10-methenyltetrahydrofolate synthetase
MSKNSADQLRIRLRGLREAIPVAERQQASAQLCAALRLWFDARSRSRPIFGHTAPEIVAGFWPLDNEPDIRPVYAYLHTQGFTVALPIVVEKQAPLEFHVWRPTDSLKPGAFGVLEPIRGEKLMPDVLLVPTLGFTDQGVRLGYGGGYYDRTLANLDAAGKDFLALGIAWDQARIEKQTDYRPEEHDYPLDAILTPSGWAQETPSV